MVTEAASPVPYETARDQLADVVRRLESGGLTLEESLDLWEQGERLATICSEWLEGARARLTAASADEAGPGEDPLDRLMAERGTHLPRAAG
jgi:exodeoxyribonuclease VII small subunit